MPAGWCRRLINGPLGNGPLVRGPGRGKNQLKKRKHLAEIQGAPFHDFGSVWLSVRPCITVCRENLPEPPQSFQAPPCRRRHVLRLVPGVPASYLYKTSKRTRREPGGPGEDLKKPIKKCRGEDFVFLRNSTPSNTFNKK